MAYVQRSHSEMTRPSPFSRGQCFDIESDIRILVHGSSSELIEYVIDLRDFGRSVQPCLMVIELADINLPFKRSRCSEVFMASIFLLESRFFS